MKGVQVVARLNGPIAQFDQIMGNKGAPTMGLILSALYAGLSDFEIRINLPSPQSI